jgi:hypothetical protein
MTSGEQPPSPDQRALDAAKKLYAGGDYEGAHAKVAAIGATSPLRESAEARGIEDGWADKLMAQADAEADVAKKRALLQRVSQATTVDAERRKAAADKILALDASGAASVPTPTQLPVATDRPHSDDPIAAARPEPTHRVTSSDPPTASPPPPSNPAPATTSGSSSNDDRERQLALQGTDDSRRLLKAQLEQRVFSGKASDNEVDLLISTCKDMGDKLCVQHARAVKQQRQQ